MLVEAVHRQLLWVQPGNYNLSLAAMGLDNPWVA